MPKKQSFAGWGL